jgi:hypothetical protein
VLRSSAVLAAFLTLAACTSSGPAAPPSTHVSTVAGPSGRPPGPVVAGPTRAVTAAACPIADETFVRDTIGMRLARITVLRSGGRVVGCRFYALQGSPLHASEHLPGPHQPAVQITTQRYTSAVAAHNAFVLLAGRAAQRVDLGSVVGLCFQTDFDPGDHGKDWACTTSVGRTEVVVRTVDTTGTFSTATITRAVLRRV